MARRKIRYCEGKKYRLLPGETLEQAVERTDRHILKTEDILTPDR